MAKKNWIMVKRGLSEDAKHREAVGNRIWLFLHIIDRTDWDSGIAYDWRDKEEADDMGMSWRTLQKQRQELEELGYITCIKHRSNQDIIVHNWINPKNYTGKTINSKSTQSLVPSNNKSTPKSTPKSTLKPYVDLGTPTSNSGIMDHGSSHSGENDKEHAVRSTHESIDTKEALSIDSIEKGAEMLSILKIAYEDKGRRPPHCFKNSFQRDAYLKVFDSLNGELAELTRKAVARDITALDRLLSWLEKCAKNNHESGGNHSSAHPTMLDIIHEAQKDPNYGK